MNILKKLLIIIYVFVAVTISVLFGFSEHTNPFTTKKTIPPKHGQWMDYKGKIIFVVDGETLEATVTKAIEEIESIPFSSISDRRLYEMANLVGADMYNHFVMLEVKEAAMKEIRRRGNI